MKFSMQNKSRIGDRASTATKALEAAWAMLIGLHHNIPHAIVTILTAGDRSHKSGHLSYSTWQYRDDKQRHEVGISPNLFHDPKRLLSTMLHEAAHAVLHKKNGGCTPVAPGKPRYYHRVSFRDTCQKFGLECEFRDTRRGWTNTSWPDGKIPDIYAQVLEHLKKELPKGTGSGIHVKAPGRQLPKSGHIKLSCKCDKRSIYVNRSVLKKGRIRCDLCGFDFLIKLHPD